MSRAATHFAEELNRLLTRMRQEYELTLCEAVGVLELVQQDLIQEARDEQEEEGE